MSTLGKTKKTTVCMGEKMALGTNPEPRGLVNPPLDELMEHVDSKYALAMFAARRARQINSYYSAERRLASECGSFGLSTRIRKAIVYCFP